MSRIRQNYREETEALVNQQINIQLTASYAYQVGKAFGIAMMEPFCILALTAAHGVTMSVCF